MKKIVTWSKMDKQIITKNPLIYFEYYNFFFDQSHKQVDMISVQEKRLILKQIIIIYQQFLLDISAFSYFSFYVLGGAACRSWNETSPSAATESE